MKCAIFGDIHANLEALAAVLADAAEQGCDLHFCTGDIVGYNANPQECVDLVRDLDCPVVMGNHDQEAAGNSSLNGFNPIAARAIEWTREHLNDESRRWLAGLPFTHLDGDATFTHATVEDPGGWAYVLNRYDALACLASQHTPLAFIGHTHQPVFYTLADGEVTIDPGPTVEVLPSTRYLINVGSVGLPRDRDRRACYVIYDRATHRVELRRVDYDDGEASRKTIAAGLR